MVSVSVNDNNSCAGELADNYPTARLAIGGVTVGIWCEPSRYVQPLGLLSLVTPPCNKYP